MLMVNNGIFYFPSLIEKKRIKKLKSRKMPILTAAKNPYPRNGLVLPPVLPLPPK